MEMNSHETIIWDQFNRELVAAYEDGTDINLVDLIAANCGWKPLVKGEQMIVSFGPNTDIRRYEIRRIE